MHVTLVRESSARAFRYRSLKLLGLQPAPRQTIEALRSKKPYARLRTTTCIGLGTALRVHGRLPRNLTCTREEIIILFRKCDILGFLDRKPWWMPSPQVNRDRVNASGDPL